MGRIFDRREGLTRAEKDAEKALEKARQGLRQVGRQHPDGSPEYVAAARRVQDAQRAVWEAYANNGAVD